MESLIPYLIVILFIIGTFYRHYHLIRSAKADATEWLKTNSHEYIPLKLNSLKFDEPTKGFTYRTTFTKVLATAYLKL